MKWALMRILVKVVTGLVWSTLFFIGSVLLGALVVSGLEYLMDLAGFLTPSSGHIFTRVVGVAIVVLGTTTGFYIGYSRALKKDAQPIGNRQLAKKLVFPVIVLSIMGFAVYILVLNIRAYNRYGFFVQVSDESVFASKMEKGDPRIVNHGRIKKDKIFRLDREVDSGDGPQNGKVRWYECYGIDCDEGWENRFRALGN
jgi:hypothetical protein